MLQPPQDVEHVERLPPEERTRMRQVRVLPLAGWQTCLSQKPLPAGKLASHRKQCVRHVLPATHQPAAALHLHAWLPTQPVLSCQRTVELECHPRRPTRVLT